MQQDKFQLALAKQGAGRCKEAAALYNEILNQDPENALAYHNLGLIVADSAGPGAAIPLFWYAVRLKPDLADGHNSLGNVLMKVGRLVEAEQSFRSASELAPETASFHFNLANVLGTLGRLSEAEQSYRRAIELDPSLHAAYNNLANILRTLNRPDDALRALAQALEINPKFALAHNNIGNIKRDMSATEEAERSYREAIRLDPKLAIAQFNLGNVLRESGRLAESAMSFRKAIELNPNTADAYRHLTQVERLKPDDGLVAVMQARYEDPLTPSEDKKHYAFALGRIFDESKDWDRAFEYFQTGNRLHRATFQYDIRAEAATLKRTREFFSAARLAEVPTSGVTDSTPIFIVGMPRSGTTLMEQILASHPEVVGGGELGYIQDLVNALRTRRGRPFPYCMEGLTPEDAAQMGATYLRRAREAFGTKARFITDKMPQNFLYLGLIDRILPEARIIYMKRDPLDVAISAFSILFTEGHPYAYDLKELGQYSRFSEQMMEHWMGLFGSKIYAQSYEAVVADSEAEVRKMLNFCGLEYNRACLEFHETKRNVNTASASQVRERLNASSIGRWKNYERHLRPLKAASGGA